MPRMLSMASPSSVEAALLSEARWRREGRFTRRKHDSPSPCQAVTYCLKSRVRNHRNRLAQLSMEIWRWIDRRGVIERLVNVGPPGEPRTITY
jgi:hypothetical protein